MLSYAFDVAVTSYGSDTSNTRKNVPSDIHAAENFFNQLQSVWISDETLFRVFDIASWRKSQQNEFTEFMIIRITYPNLLHGSDLL